MWGNMPNKYWSQPRFDEATNLSGVTMMETILTRSVPCYGCSVACGREVTLKDTPYGVEVVDGPEYETVAMLGSLLLVDDLPGVAYAGHLCNRYGLDTISAGSSIALAYLLYDRGFITTADTGGLPLKWGDIEVGPHALGDDRPAEGLWRRPGRWREANLPPAMKLTTWQCTSTAWNRRPTIPRALSGMAVIYATSPRGACHCRGTCTSSTWA